MFCNEGGLALAHYSIGNFRPGRSLRDPGRVGKRLSYSGPSDAYNAKRVAEQEAAHRANAELENPDWVSLKVKDRVRSSHWGDGVVRTIIAKSFDGRTVQVSGLRGFCNPRVLFKVKEE